MTQEQTTNFYSLTPEHVLKAVENLGIRCTGRALALNSMENRVYEVEVEVQEDLPPRDPKRFRVVKFYRPGRWSREQILEEHRFLADLEEAQIPVVSPIVFTNKSTVEEAADLGIFYSVFPKVGGRLNDELQDEQVARLGRLLARIHTVGAQSDAPSRIKLDPTSYGLDGLQYILSQNFIPPEITKKFEETVGEICNLTNSLLKGVPYQRVHGDCHFGNILWSDEGPFFVDFDDMVRGPCVQDIWLIVPGRDVEAKIQLDVLVDGYQEMRRFDRATLRLIEPLRTLRMINFSAWLARRWEDPAFKRVFTYFGESGFWHRHLAELEDQLPLIREVC